MIGRDIKMRNQKKKLTKIRVPRTIKKSDLKLYLSFCMEHVKETDTPEDIDRMWKKFKKSLRDAAKEIVSRANEL